MSRILFVINPISGGTDKGALLTTIDSWAKSSNHELVTWETTGEGDPTKLRGQIDKHEPDKVVAVGGDGTLLLCAKVLKQSGIPLGLIPGGSANGMAAELGIPEKPEEALHLIDHGQIIDADMLSFNDGQYEGLHISDIGLNANLVREFDQSERRGFLGYARGLLDQLIHPNLFHATLTLDGKEHPSVSFMVAFANASHYGTGATLTQEGRPDDGKFEVYVLNELDLAGIAGQWLNILPDDPFHFEVHQVTEATVVLEQPQWLQIDGELIGEVEEVRVKIIPGCLKLIGATSSSQD